MGRLRYYKGLDTLIRALPQIPARLVVAGIGPMEAEWKALAAELGVAGRISWLGEVSDDDLPALYHAADLFVLPASHKSEAFGLVQVEAMAAGLPVVCTELGTGTSYVNLHGVTGLVVSPRDPDGLAAAINALLADPERREGLLGLLSVAREEVARLDAILTQFLRAIRPSNPRFGPLRPDVVLREALALLQPEIENHGVGIKLDLHEPIPIIQADRDQIKQAFYNVIKNAVDVLPPGGTLQIAVLPGSAFVEIVFRDNGPGVPPDVMSRLFEPYFTTKASGNGLGLMIVQRIVQEHGGHLDVASEPGRGTAFTLSLPLAERRMRLLEARTPAAD